MPPPEQAWSQRTRRFMRARALRRCVCMSCAALYAAGSIALADTLTTKNGDTLQGNVLEERPDVVIFDSLTFGRLTVGRDAIVSLERAPAAQPPKTAAKPAPADIAGARSAKADESPQPSPGDRVGQFLARINPLKDWKTKFNLGFVMQRGDDNDNNLNFRLRSERKAPDGDEHLITGRYDYAEDVFQDGTRSKTDQLLAGQYQYRHDTSRIFFVQSNSTYYRDVIKELFHEVTQTVGLGYRMKGERWKADVIPAIGYRVRDISHTWSDGPVVGAYQNYSLSITETLTLREGLQYLVAPNDLSDYSLRWNVELTQKLGAVWNLALRYDYAYDAVVGTEAKSLEQRWAVTVGVEF